MPSLLLYCDCLSELIEGQFIRKCHQKAHARSRVRCDCDCDCRHEPASGPPSFKDRNRIDDIHNEEEDHRISNTSGVILPTPLRSGLVCAYVCS